MDRREFIQVAAAVPILPYVGRSDAFVQERGVYVARDRDRFGEERKGGGGAPMQIKVSSADSAGAFFLFELMHSRRGGGPPRHFHYDQDEWFYCNQGEYLVEVGGVRYTLRPGDSVLAPRRVPHAFTFLGGDQPGRLLVGFTPAGRMEDFFRELERRGAFFGSGTDEDRARLREFGMENVGPPIQL